MLHGSSRGLTRITAIVLVGVMMGAAYMIWLERRHMSHELKVMWLALNDSDKLREEMEFALDDTQQSLHRLSEEKQQLYQELSAIRQNLAQSETDLTVAKNRLNSLESFNIDLATDVARLSQQRAALARQPVGAISPEELLEAQVRSLRELQQAIRDTREQVHAAKMASRLMADQQGLLEGNRGYLMYQGKSTFPAGVHIYVRPATAPSEP